MRQLDAYSLGKIKDWEGLRTRAYKDSAGIWTIGYGHTGPGVNEGLEWTLAQCDAALVADTAKACAAVESAVKVPLSDHQFGALVSFAYNAGIEAFKGSTLLRVLNMGNYAMVPAQLERWNKATVNGKLVVLDGLTNRRAKEAALWNG